MLHLDYHLSCMNTKKDLLASVFALVIVGLVLWSIISYHSKNPQTHYFTPPSQEVSTTSSLSSLLKKYSIKDEKDGDIDGDGTTDRLLVLISPLEEKVRKLGSRGQEAQDELDENPINHRRLVIVLNQKDGQKVFINTNVVLCMNCAGMEEEDPYGSYEDSDNGISIDTKNHLVSISDSGGSSYRFGDTYTFQYEKLSNDFYIYSYEYLEYSTIDKEEVFDGPNTYTIPQSELPRISFSNYDPLTQQIELECYVAKQSLPLYSEPNKSSENLRGFIKKGTVFETNSPAENFAYTADLEKSDVLSLKGAYAAGFIPKEMLFDDKYATVSFNTESGKCSSLVLP
jgi:hypothetical protein